MDLSAYFAIVLQQHIMAKCLKDSKSVLECRDKYITHQALSPNAKNWLKANRARSFYIIDPNVQTNDDYGANPNNQDPFQYDFVTNLMMLKSPFIVSQYAAGITHILSNGRTDKSLGIKYNDADDAAGAFFPSYNVAVTAMGEHSISGTDVSRHEAAHAVQKMFESGADVFFGAFMKDLNALTNKKRDELVSFLDAAQKSNDDPLVYLTKKMKEKITSIDWDNLPHPADIADAYKDNGRTDSRQPEHLETYAYLAYRVRQLPLHVKHSIDDADATYAKELMNKFFPNSGKVLSLAPFHKDSILSNNPAFIAAYEADVKRLMPYTNTDGITHYDTSDKGWVDIDLTYSLSHSVKAAFTTHQKHPNGKCPENTGEHQVGLIHHARGSHDSHREARYEAFAEMFSALTNTYFSPENANTASYNFPCSSKFVQTFIDAVHKEWGTTRLETSVDVIFDTPPSTFNNVFELFPPNLALTNQPALP